MQKNTVKDLRWTLGEPLRQFTVDILVWEADGINSRLLWAQPTFRWTET